MEKNENFSFTYSAQQKKEVENIRSKYLPKQESKMDQLRWLHGIPGKKAMTAALTVGIIGALIMGTGMSLAMTPIGEGLGSLAMVLGIGVGLVGMVLVALAYPIYTQTLKKERSRIAPEILKLTDELLQ